jgi:nucleoid DNA-binding protein
MSLKKPPVELSMTRSDVIYFLKEHSGISNKEATSNFEIVFSEMTNAQSRGDRVEIRGFC